MSTANSTKSAKPLQDDVQLPPDVLIKFLGSILSDLQREGAQVGFVVKNNSLYLKIHLDGHEITTSETPNGIDLKLVAFPKIEMPPTSVENAPNATPVLSPTPTPQPA